MIIVFNLFVGMFDSGLGVSQINTLFSALNAPTIHASTMRRYERYIAGLVDQAAMESCEKVILSEEKLTQAFNNKQ